MELGKYFEMNDDRVGQVDDFVLDESSQLLVYVHQDYENSAFKKKHLYFSETKKN